jgi:hypothetical protein
MRNPKYTLLAGGAYLALIGLFALTSTKTGLTQNGKPQGPDVRVVNTAAEPVPVRLQSTAAPVPVLLQGTSEPVPVHIEGTTQIDASTPLNVHDLDNPALHPVQFRSQIIIDDTEGVGGETLFTVPQGKRLVIEHVSAGAELPPNQRGVLRLQTQESSRGTDHFIPFTQVNLIDIVHMMAAQPTRIYVNPGAVLAVFFQRDGNADGRATCTVTVTGHLVALN